VKRKIKPRTGVHVMSSSPTLYRQFSAIATPYAAKRADDGSFTVIDESRWAVLLLAYETKELAQ
jgi:hypothetical protein